MLLIVYVGTAILITLFVMGVAAKLAKEKGKNPFKWAGLSFLALFVLVFWDYYPTKWTHQYYCEKEAGFWVYKTLEQWKAENPGVMEGLQQSLEPSQHTSDGDLYVLDERFAIQTHRRYPIPFLITRISENQFLDRKTGAVLAKGVDIGSGSNYLDGLKFWLYQEPCYMDGIRNLSTELQNMRSVK